jgi:3-keto-disaccharide hydrolase
MLVPAKRRCFALAATVTAGLALGFPALSGATGPSPTTSDNFTTLLDGTLTGTPASFDKWLMSGPGAFVPYGDNEGFATTGGLGMLWYPKDFGDAIFRINYRDVRTATTGYSNGGIMVGFPAEQICTPLYPATPACTHQVPYTERPATWTYNWGGMPGPFPPAQTYTNNPALGDPASGLGHACGQIGTAQTNTAWVAVYCGNEIQVNDSPDMPVFTGDPIKTGSVYNMRDLSAQTGFGGSGAQARLNADVAAGWKPGTPRAWHEMEIQKIGQQWTIFVDGVLVNQYDNAIPLQPKRAGDPPSSAREFAGSTLGLQNHGGSDHIEYRNVQVKEIASPPHNTAAPQIAGAKKVGGELTCLPGEWQNATPADVSYQWFRSNDASQTIGALAPTETEYDSQLVGTDAKYTATAADLATGKILWCRVSASTAQGTVYAYAEAPVDHPISVGGTVPATLSLTLGAPATLGSFLAGVAHDYTASTTATVVSTAGDAALTVADPSTTATGHLVNGAFSLPQALQAAAGGTFANVGGTDAPTNLKTWTGPTSNEATPVNFKQSIGAGDALRTGSYSKTLTFTLSTTTP